MTCEHETKSFIPNGCGPKASSLWGKVLFRLIPNLIFKNECNCHDYAYFYGGVKTIDKASRFKADSEFLWEMKQKIDKIYFWRRVYYKKIVIWYFNAVRKYGEKSFNWLKDEYEWFTHLEKNGYSTIWLEDYILANLKKRKKK